MNSKQRLGFGLVACSIAVFPIVANAMADTHLHEPAGVEDPSPSAFPPEPEPPPSPTPDPNDAVLASYEQRRDEAEAEWNRLLSESPAEDLPLLVSFESPLPTDDVLDAAQVQGVRVTGLWTWTFFDGASIPGVGQYRLDADLDFSSPPEKVRSEIDARLIDALQARLDMLIQVSEDDQQYEIGSVLGKQIADMKKYLEILSATGSRIFGLECTCSPDSLEALISSAWSTQIVVVETRKSAPIEPFWPSLSSHASQEG